MQTENKQEPSKQPLSISISGEEMPWGHVLAMADTTLDSMVKKPSPSSEILNSAQP